MKVSIVGWAHTKFGKLEGEDTESLIGGQLEPPWTMPV